MGSQSSYWQDGYRDGYNGKHASPPGPYEFAGKITNVFASEYLQGWMKGQADKRDGN